jgi:aldose 1-epimerase
MITLESHRLRLSVSPELGAGIADFSLRATDGGHAALMRRAADGETNASNLGSFFMAPWVNRIRGGKFSFDGKEHALRINTNDGMAQHGDVRKRPWRVTMTAANAATLEFDSRDFSDINWPWAFQCRAIYTLIGTERGGRMRLDLLVRNVSDEPMPAACGHHPYFMRKLWNERDEMELAVPVAARYPLEAGCATAGPKEDQLTRTLRTGGPIPPEHIDAVFIADSTAANVATLRWPASGVTLRIAASANMSHWVVYCPHESRERVSPLPFIAVEPQTAVNDALNLAGRGVWGTGTVVVPPGKELVTSCVFEAEVG